MILCRSYKKWGVYNLDMSTVLLVDYSVVKIRIWFLTGVNICILAPAYKSNPNFVEIFFKIEMSTNLHFIVYNFSAAHVIFQKFQCGWHEEIKVQPNVKYWLGCTY